MKPLPLPVRIAAGLAVAAVEQARHLPEKLAELPVTVVSQALQLSMRLQQQVTELAIKGDDALATLRPVEESPAWATFDEDETATDYDATAPTSGQAEPAAGLNHARSRFDAVTDDLDDAESTMDPWAQEEQALRTELADTDVAASTEEPQAEAPAETAPETTVAAAPPAALANYPELTLPQLRARLRTLTEDGLTELVEYERAHANRPDFVGMLTRRIATVRDNAVRDNGVASVTERNSAKRHNTPRTSR
jgi:hypothetical protein